MIKLPLLNSCCIRCKNYNLTTRSRGETFRGFENLATRTKSIENKSKKNQVNKTRYPIENDEEIRKIIQVKPEIYKCAIVLHTNI